MRRDWFKLVDRCWALKEAALGDRDRQPWLTGAALEVIDDWEFRDTDAAQLCRAVLKDSLARSGGLT